MSDYSGRFMYGNICIGIVCPDIPNAMLELGSYLGDDIKMLGSHRTDSLGKEFIIYFPNIS